MKRTDKAREIEYVQISVEQLHKFAQVCSKKEETSLHKFLGLESYQRPSLQGLKAERISLNGADLSGADLSYISLRQAVLFNANLTGANLTGANLTGAYLTGANLTGANIQEMHYDGATLENVIVIGTQFDTTKILGIRSVKELIKEPAELLVGSRLSYERRYQAAKSLRYVANENAELDPSIKDRYERTAEEVISEIANLPYHKQPVEYQADMIRSERRELLRNRAIVGLSNQGNGGSILPPEVTTLIINSLEEKDIVNLAVLRKTDIEMKEGSSLKKKWQEKFTQPVESVVEKVENDKKKDKEQCVIS